MVRNAPQIATALLERTARLLAGLALLHAVFRVHDQPMEMSGPRVPLPRTVDDAMRPFRRYCDRLRQDAKSHDPH